MIDRRIIGPSSGRVTEPEGLPGIDAVQFRRLVEIGWNGGEAASRITNMNGVHCHTSAMAMAMKFHAIQ